MDVGTDTVAKVHRQIACTWGKAASMCFRYNRTGLWNRPSYRKKITAILLGYVHAHPILLFLFLASRPACFVSRRNTNVNVNHRTNGAQKSDAHFPRPAHIATIHVHQTQQGSTL